MIIGLSLGRIGRSHLVCDVIRSEDVGYPPHLFDRERYVLIHTRYEPVPRLQHLLYRHMRGIGRCIVSSDITGGGVHMEMYGAYRINHLLRVVAEYVRQEIDGLKLVPGFLGGHKEVSRIQAETPVLELDEIAQCPVVLPVQHPESGPPLIFEHQSERRLVPRE